LTLIANYWLVILCKINLYLAIILWIILNHAAIKVYTLIQSEVRQCKVYAYIFRWITLWNIHIIRGDIRIVWNVKKTNVLIQFLVQRLIQSAINRKWYIRLIKIWLVLLFWLVIGDVCLV
jgi:hypothetical protein